MDKYERTRNYYDGVYHKGASASNKASHHLDALVRRLKINNGCEVLDVGCGTGQWLLAVRNHGGIPCGVDISKIAIDACRQTVPDAELYCRPAEQLPWENNRFDVVTCLGSLEHFVDPVTALREMCRVAKPDAVFVILVPNAGFLTRRLGLYKGTDQTAIREEVRTLEQWEELFAEAGLRVTKRWRDLHVLSWSWISKGRFYAWPVRAAQAFILPLWPISWQYQIYHECVRRK